MPTDYYKDIIEKEINEKRPIPLHYLRDKEIHDLTQELQSNGYERFLPLVHGTSKTYAEKIMKEGLQPREKTKLQSNWSNHNQGFGSDLTSEEDKVYFSRCQDTQLPMDSAYKASRITDRDIPTKEGKRYLLLIQPKKYFDKMVEDEDYRKYKEVMIKNSIYTDQNLENMSSYDARKKYPDKGYGQEFCNPRVPKKVIDAFDRVWVSQYLAEQQKPKDKQRLFIPNTNFERILESIPRGLQSIYAVQTLGIKGSVAPEDLQSVNEDDYYNMVKTTCSSFREGCDENEYKLKNEYGQAIDEYNQIIHYDLYKSRHCSDVEPKYLKRWCTKIPRSFVDNHVEYKNMDEKVDWYEKVTPEIEEQAKKEAKDHLIQSRQKLIDYIKKEKFDPKYPNLQFELEEEE